MYRANDGCFHQHYGRDNMIRNNIFAFATHGQIVRTRAETHRSFVCQRNIVYYTQGEPLGDKFPRRPTAVRLQLLLESRPASRRSSPAG